MDFSYTEEEKILADTVRRFAKNEIIHHPAKDSRTGSFLTFVSGLTFTDIFSSCGTMDKTLYVGTQEKTSNMFHDTSDFGIVLP